MTDQPTRDEPIRPVEVTIAITDRDGVTTSYHMKAATAEEERTHVWGHPLDVRFTLSDVKYST